MNAFNFTRSVRAAGRVAVVLLAVLLAGSVRAEEPQAGRYLLIFETSPAFKKNLPAIRELLDKLFASNLQNEIKTDDDVAVWIVDKKLHTAAFPLANWAPDEAGVYADRLCTFLADQSASRHASLAPIQPLLNRIVKDSRLLTVLIVGDTDSRLVGTPYDDGVNEIITNAASRSKGPVTPFIIVLRAYHGEYLGCSVNRSGALNFPRFPLPKPPAKPVVAPPPPPPPPVVKTGLPLIMVGTKDESTVPASQSATLAPPAPAPVSTTAPPVLAPAEHAAPKMVAAPPVPTPTVLAPPAPRPPAPVASPPPPVPAPVPIVQPTTPPLAVVAPTPAKITPVAVVPAAPVVPVPAAPPPPVVAVVTPPAATNGWLLPLALAAVALLATAVIVLALVVRARRPTGSLISRSMQNDRDE